jgi:WD40 repeat protein
MSLYGRGDHSGNLIYRGHTNLVLTVAWSPDGTRLASSAPDYQDDVGRSKSHLVHVWEPEGDELLYTCDAGRTVACLAWSPDGALLATRGDWNERGDWTETVDLWESATGPLVRALPTPMASICDLAWSPSGDRIALAGDSRERETADGEPVAANVVLDARTGAVLTRYDGHTGLWNQGITWSPDGVCLASAGYDDKTILIWDAATGATRERVALGVQNGKDRDKALLVAWSPDGH